MDYLVNSFATVSKELFVAAPRHRNLLVVIFELKKTPSRILDYKCKECKHDSSVYCEYNLLL